MKNYNINTEILKIQNSIYNTLHSNNGVSVHFNFDGNTLVVVTFNKKTNTFFLLKEIDLNSLNLYDREDGEILAYKQMEFYVNTIVNCVNSTSSNECAGNSYTVEWSKKGDPSNKSYFYGADIEDVIRKFYFGKEAYKELYTIYDIKLNPIA